MNLRNEDMVCKTNICPSDYPRDTIDPLKTVCILIAFLGICTATLLSKITFRQLDFGIRTDRKPGFMTRMYHREFQGLVVRSGIAVLAGTITGTVVMNAY